MVQGVLQLFGNNVCPLSLLFHSVCPSLSLFLVPSLFLPPAISFSLHISLLALAHKLIFTIGSVCCSVSIQNELAQEVFEAHISVLK